MMLTFWNHLLSLGRAHGVDPRLFALLYLAHHPLFWGTVAYLTTRARRHQSLGGTTALAVFFWLMPYAYLVLFGRGLPLWLYGIAVISLAIGAPQAIKRIRSGLHSFDGRRADASLSDNMMRK